MSSRPSRKALRQRLNEATPQTTIPKWTENLIDQLKWESELRQSEGEAEAWHPSNTRTMRSRFTRRLHP